MKKISTITSFILFILIIVISFYNMANVLSGVEIQDGYLANTKGLELILYIISSLILLFWVFQVINHKPRALFITWICLILVNSLALFIPSLIYESDIKWMSIHFFSFSVWATMQMFIWNKIYKKNL